METIKKNLKKLMLCFYNMQTRYHIIIVKINKARFLKLKFEITLK